LNPTSLDSLLMRAGSRDDPALWHRERGAWTPGGHSPGRDIRELAAALIHFGIGAGRTALVLGGEGPDTTRAALAVLTAGACLVRLDAGASDALLLEALHASRVALALVEDDRQLQRVLALRPDLPELELVILLAGEQSERKAAALLVASAVDIGAALLDRDPRVLARARADLPEVAPAVLVPSGARLTPLSADAVAALAHRLTDEVSVGPGRAVLVMLPPDGVESLAVVLGALSRGATVLVVSDHERIDLGLREKVPDGAFISAATLSRLREEWLEDLAQRPLWFQSLTRWALREGADPARHPRRYRIADWLVLSRIRARWGGRLRGWGVLRADVPQEVSGFFASIGVPIYVMPGIATAAVAR
jgi:long-chain acyl-CoA synthetase